MKKAIITGITGQDGAYLAKLLLDKGYKVYGAQRRNTGKSYWRLDELGITNQIEFVDVDLMEPYNIERVLEKIEVDEFYNLAAQSFVALSFEQPQVTTLTNSLGVLNILEVLRNKYPQIKFYQASTSEMFGKVVETPQKETTRFYPRSPYGVAKVYSHWITINYRESYDLHASCGILFNHESPRRGETFVTRKITRAATRIKLGLQEKLYLGNLDAKRDWGFAGDYVEAMWLMLQQDRPDDFVIATGETHTVKEFLEVVFEHAGLKIQDHVEIDSRLFRPHEVPLLLGDASKAKEKLGWVPKTKFKELAK